MRGWLDDVVAALARLILRVFYRRIEVTGLERLPVGAPLLVVANHQNSLVDAMMLLGFLRRRTRVLAKHTLWSHPLVGPLLSLAGSYPVYRREDGASPRENAVTFALCARDLARGGVVALFPEGRSNAGSRLLPLKTGAARLALLAAREHGADDLRVAPVALAYEERGRFRSRARLRVGAPFAPGGAEGAHGLTAHIAGGLQETLAEAVAWPTEPPSPVVRARRLRAWLASPFNWTPYRLPGWVADRLTRTADEPATYKVLTGMLSFPACWSLQALLAASLGGAPAAAATLALAVLTARLALPAMDPTVAPARG